MGKNLCYECIKRKTIYCPNSNECFSMVEDKPYFQNKNDVLKQLQSYKDREDKAREILPLDLAIYFHETYERLAPSFGYETREETKQFENNSKNGMLMVAVCEVILNKLLQILNGRND